MKKAMGSSCRRAVVIITLTGLLISFAACSSQPVISIQPIGTMNAIPATPALAPTPSPTIEPTPSPTAVPTPTPTPEPTPTPVPPAVDGLGNSSGAYPYIIRSGTALFYINTNDKSREYNTIFRMKMDGSKRTAVLPKALGLKLFKKIQKNAVSFAPQNLLYVQQGRLFFLGQTAERIPGKGKKAYSGEYVFSIDFEMKNLKIEQQIVKPGNDEKYWRWFRTNSQTAYTGSLRAKCILQPIAQNGWCYYTDLSGKLFKEKLGGSGKTLLYGETPVDRIIVQDGWIYFEKRQFIGIYRISVDGGKVIMLGDATNVDHTMSGFVIHGDWIYYNDNDKKTMEFSLHKLKTDGSADILITTRYSPYSFQIINDQIFYNTIRISERLNNGSVRCEIDWNLRVMNLDGTGDRAIDTPAKK